MALLDRGNTVFDTSVNRWFPHYRSKALDRLISALVEAQNNPADTAKLLFLYQKLREWVTDHPKEYAARGKRVGYLVYEIERKAQQLGLNVVAEAQAFWLQVTSRVALVWTPLVSLNAPLSSHDADWAITVTDVPTGEPGVYDHLPEDRYSLEDRGLALAALGAVHAPQNNSNYWLRLGKFVTTPRDDTHRYGRCYSCAAAVIYTLVMDPQFDAYLIEHVASTGYDHHLVLVGRSNANGATSAGLNDGKNQWKYSTIVVDAWQKNLDPEHSRFSTLALNNQYATGSDLTWYCAYTVANRGVDRNFAQQLPAVNRVAARPDMVRDARQAVANQGLPTRNVRQDGRWVVQELRLGAWVTV